MISLITNSPEETYNIAYRVAQHAYPGDIYCLEGGLASGKTVFAQGFARGLGITEEVRSPSFAIVQEYVHDPPLYHMDFYRLSDAADLLGMGADEYFSGTGICLIEWPDRAGDILPIEIVRVQINTGSGEGRKIMISAASASTSECLERLKRIDEIRHALF